MSKNEIRKDYIQDKYVIIAPRRGKRPHNVERPELLIKPKISDCPFCPQNLDRQKSILSVGENPWQLKVVKNKFPAVTLDSDKAYGVQEVMIETPDHNQEVEDLKKEHIVKIFDVYAQRTKKISENKKIEYILIFKNNGGKAGESIRHAHSQIFATSFIPPHLIDKSQKVQKYKLEKGSCVYCDVIKKESRGSRLVFQDNNVIAFTPYASIYNYEIWLMPKRHLDNITLLSYDEKISFAVILKKILNKINKLHLPYNYYFHQVINDQDQHLYMKITPRGSIWAGVEIGSGLIINPISPEEAAKFYRR